MRSAEEKAARPRGWDCWHAGMLANLLPWRGAGWATEDWFPLYCCPCSAGLFAQSSNRARSKPSLHSRPASPSAYLPSTTACTLGLMFLLLHASSLTPSSFCSLLSRGWDHLFFCPAAQHTATQSLSYSHTLLLTQTHTSAFCLVTALGEARFASAMWLACVEEICCSFLFFSQVNAVLCRACKKFVCTFINSSSILSLVCDREA